MNYLEKLFNIENKVIVITGGSGVLGMEMAKGLLKAGAKVILLGTNKDKINFMVKTLNRISRKAAGFVCNVLDEDNLKKINKEVITRFKRIDVLINAAGGQVPGTTIGINENVFDMKITDFKKVIDLNLNGTVLPTLVFGKTISKQKNGSIINISSMAAYRAITRVVGYSAAKSAVENFTKWMAVELALKFGDGIRVNAIAPGFFISEQNKNILMDKKGQLTDRAKLIINLTPFKRFGKPNELIGTTLFLASDASKFITGCAIPVDGGFSAFSGV